MAAALLLGLATIATASPSLATPRAGAHPGHAAHAQTAAIAGAMTHRRANALRACNALANTFSQPTYGDMQFDEYRACMAQHGERE